MKIKVVKLEHTTREIEVDKASTVSDVLGGAEEMVGGTDHYTVLVNGGPADPSQTVAPNDIVILVPNVQAG